MGLFSVFALAVACFWSPTTRAADPPRATDELLRLVPEDASLVLTVENLRDHVQVIGGSRLLADLRRLPAVTSWLESDRFRHLKRSCAEIETVLGVKLAEVRDQLLGDAVVLVLRLPPGTPVDPSRARGVLMLRARDPALLERVIASFNTAQEQSGELLRIGVRTRAKTVYHIREFRPESGRPAEWYVSYPDGTFVFSNSEEMIRGVMDRKSAAPDAVAAGSSDEVKPGNGTPGSGLAESPRMIAVRKRLPERALARLFVDPRAVERLTAMAPRPARPSDGRALAMLRRYLAAVDYAGAALVWGSDAIVVHGVETLNVAKVEAWVRRWATDPRTCRPELRRVPTTAVATACAHIDFHALREAAYDIVPVEDHPRLRNLEILLMGLLLGHDLLQMVPVIGPGVVAYLDAPPESTSEKPESPGPTPARGGLFPLVIVVDLAPNVDSTNPHPFRGGPPHVVVIGAMENAMRTILTLMALDEKHGGGRGTVVVTKAADSLVLTLSVPIPFAYAIDHSGRLVMGTSAGAVARYLENASDPEAGARFRAFQAVAFPKYETFVCVDLGALTGLAGKYRARVAQNLAARQHRPAAAVEGDLEHLLGLARLFRAAFVASKIEPDVSAIHRAFGVILKDASERSGPQ